jgi:DNA-binding CsgD family transcriptional regulator
MTVNGPHLNIPQERPPYNYAVHRLAQLQTDLIASARMWAMDEVGAAVAHQLNDPLTALLIYLHEIQQAGTSSPGSGTSPIPAMELVGRAVHEAERACAILERMRQDPEFPVDAASAVSRGRDAINACAGHNARGSSARTPRSTGPVDAHSLTPREREVLDQVIAGASNKAGSHQLGISRRTFEAHRAHLMRKLGARNAADLVRVTMR